MTARRGTITDRNGIELAVSEDSVTVFAHPFLIDDPAKVAARIAPLVGRTESELLEKLSDKESTFVYLRRKMDATLGQRIEELGIEGIGTVVEPKRTYPQGHLAVPGARHGRHGQHRPRRARVLARRAAARARTASAASSRTRSASRSAWSRSSARSRARTCG